MRLRRSRLKQYYHRVAIPKKDNEGSSYIEYCFASSFMGEAWPAGGKLQAEMYGQRINNIVNCRVDGTYAIVTDQKGKTQYCFDDITVQEGDGICLNVTGNHDPDYKVISIRPYRYLYMELERI